MDENQNSINLNFKVGDYVDTNVNGRAFIVDILRSESSDRVIVCAEFTYNFPNPRKFDMIVITPEAMAGVDKWVVCDGREFGRELVDKCTSLSDKVYERLGKDKI